MSESQAQLSRFAAVFAGGTIISRVAGLVRDMVVGALVPAASLDAFVVAFRLPNMLRDMIGEGATNAAFVPVLAESQERESEPDYRELVSAALSAMFLLFCAITVVGVLLMPLFPAALDALQPLTHAKPKEAEQVAVTVRLLQWTFPYLLFIGVAVFAMGPLFVAKRYGTASWSPALLNVALILCCVALRNVFGDPAWALVCGVWLGGIAQLVAMFWSMRKHVGVWLPNFHLRHPGIPKVFWLLGPVVVGQATGEVNKLVDSLFAYSLEHGTVTSLFYANRLIQLPLSVFGVAVAVAILPSISRAGARHEPDAIRETLMYGMRRTFFLIAPAMAGLILLREPIIRLLFERGHFSPEIAKQTATAVFYYGLGLLSFAWVKVSVQGFYAVQNTKTPVIVASASMFLNILLNCALVGPLGYRGLALSTSISFTVNFVFLYVLLSDRFGPLWDEEFLRALVRILLATAIMTAVLYGVHAMARNSFGDVSLWGKTMTVLIPVAVGGGVYIVLGRVLAIPELDHFLAAFRREPPDHS